jgi:hypothetical protein
VPKFQPCQPVDAGLAGPFTITTKESSCPWSPLIRAIKTRGPHAVAEPNFLLPVVVLPEALLGRTVMAKLINELLLLTCMGAFIASATYAVTLLH